MWEKPPSEIRALTIWWERTPLSHEGGDFSGFLNGLWFMAALQRFHPEVAEQLAMVLRAQMGGIHGERVDHVMHSVADEYNGYLTLERLEDDVN